MSGFPRSLGGSQSFLITAGAGNQAKARPTVFCDTGISLLFKMLLLLFFVFFVCFCFSLDAVMFVSSFAVRCIL